MSTTTQLELLHKHRETLKRLADLELADLDRQIKELERAKAKPPGKRQISDHWRAMLLVMQEARVPLPPREIASRMHADPRAVCRWLVAAKQRGFVERVDGARYQVAKEVPPL